MRLEKRKNGVPGIMEMPKPRPGGGLALKASLFALFAVLCVGGAAFWLTREPEIKAKWREGAADAIDGAASGTPLAGVGNVLRESPPPPPAAVTNPRTAPGTLAGQVVQGNVGGAPGENSQNPRGASSGAGAGQNAPSVAGQGEQPRTVMPKVTADSRVRPDFVEDMAAYIVSRYRPGASGGTLAVSVQGLNQRYGAKMNGAAQGGRAGLLRYAFQPTMLKGLYALYVDRFMAALSREAGSRSLSAEQTRQLHNALAGRLVMLAGGLEGVVDTPGLDALLKTLEQRSENVLEINSQMTAAVFDLDQLREGGASGSRLSAAQMRVDGLHARYRRALDNRHAAQRALVAAIRKGGGHALDDDSLLFLASWVERRAHDGGDAAASVRSAAQVLRDLSSRCAQAADARNGSESARTQALPTGQGL